MSDDVKRMSIKEFRREGYLQEVNRRLLHPLGLALEVVIDDQTGEEKLGGVWDYRDDPEGLWFGMAYKDKERMEAAQEKMRNIQRLWNEREPERSKRLGFMIEPIQEDGND